MAVAVKMADEFRKKGLYENAIGLYEYAAGNCTDSKEAIVAQRKVVITNIDLGDEDGASAAMESLRVGFADDKQLPGQVYDIGEYYRNRKKYAHARGVYQSVIDDWPGTGKAMWSAQKCIVMDIDLSAGDPNHPPPEIPPDILQAIDNLIVDCNDLPQLARAVFYLGEEYYLLGMGGSSRRVEKYRDYFKNAIRIWEIAINDTAFEKTYTPFAYYMCAHCCEQTGQVDKAITYYEKLTEDGYRHGKYAYRAPYRLGIIYRHLRDYEPCVYWFEQQRKLHSNEPLAERALYYQGLVYLKNLKGYRKAAEILQKYMDDYPEGESAKMVPYNLAACYRKTGDRAAAIDILEEAVSKYSSDATVERCIRMLNELQKGGE